MARTSALIIAHNEATHIQQCIESLLFQTRKLDEIILIAHNCSDDTETIARSYMITVVPYKGPQGITYARIEGLAHVTGDIILCIDGDSYAPPNWAEVMADTLMHRNNALVGSWVKFKGTLFGWVSNLFNQEVCVGKKNPARWIWGPSMAFWERDKELVRDIFKKSIDLSRELGLTRNPDDYWLACFMGQRGYLEVTNETFVVNHTKETTSTDALKRSFENVRNAKKIDAYFKKK